MLSRIIGLFFLLSYGTVQAHQPDLSSTILAEQGENKWVLQIRSALTAFEYEIENQFGKSSYATPEEFQELVIRHVIENISIVFDENKEAKLQNPFVKLGHETNIVFQVEGVPNNFSTVNFKNSSFKNIGRNQSALIILKKGFSKKQFVLNNENQHTAKIAVKDRQFVALTVSAVISNKNYSTIGGLIALVLFSALLFFIRK